MWMTRGGSVYNLGRGEHLQILTEVDETEESMSVRVNIGNTLRDVLKVQADGSHYVLVRRQPVVDIVGVIHDVSAEK